MIRRVLLFEAEENACTDEVLFSRSRLVLPISTSPRLELAVLFSESSLF